MWRIAGTNAPLPPHCDNPISNRLVSLDTFSWSRGASEQIMHMHDLSGSRGLSLLEPTATPKHSGVLHLVLRTAVRGSVDVPSFGLSGLSVFIRVHPWLTATA